ncbi:IS66 family transposase [Shewanella sp. MBTL60-007]|uniref:IS66 family transposase n=1 Tax=Shewanella sp. MBTL60-007 TaxID=2815911 RepID=UPI001C8012B9|nr:IS66 family transposase [Shewanella sp. MBTL60-007]
MNKKTLPPAPDFDSPEEAKEIIQFLWHKLAELEDRLNQNSRNSSVPPSKQALHHQSKNTSPTRKKSTKKVGAQPGHKGHRRLPHPSDGNVLVEQYLPPSKCQCGGRVITNCAPYKKHQIFDLPDVHYTVQEHQAYQGQCTCCGEKHKAYIPVHVPNTQLGENLHSFIAIQATQHHQSVGKIQMMLNDVFGLYFSTGAISEAQGRVTVGLETTHEAIHHKIKASELLMADETSHQRNGCKSWMWAVLSNDVAFFQINSHRNQHAAKRLLGEAVKKLLITDQYSAYRYIDDSKRQLCWAHVLRNVIAIAESVHPENQKIGEKLALIAHSIFRAHHRFIENKLNRDIYLRRLKRLRRSWLALLKQGSYQCTKRYRGRCKYLLDDDAMLWRFMDEPDCPLTNNAAERILRGYVLMRKCCYVTRSYRGDLFRERMFSLLETAKLQGINAYQWLRDIVKSHLAGAEYVLPDFLSIEAAP